MSLERKRLNNSDCRRHFSPFNNFTTLGVLYFPIENSSQNKTKTSFPVTLLLCRDNPKINLTESFCGWFWRRTSRHKKVPSCGLFEGFYSSRTREVFRKGFLCRLRQQLLTWLLIRLFLKLTHMFYKGCRSACGNPRACVYLPQSTYQNAKNKII